MRRSLFRVSLLASIWTLPRTGHAVEDDMIWAAYQTRLVCSGVFVSGRTMESVLKHDLPAWGFKTDLDLVRQRVVTESNGKKVTALYRGPRLGCTVYPDDKPEFPVPLSIESVQSKSKSRVSPMKLWPEGERSGADRLSPQTERQIRAFLDHEFSEEDPLNPKRNTRALVVVHKGRIVGERYAESIGIRKETRLVSWSMTKSVTSALIGILVDQNKLGLHEPLDIPQWKDDQRGEITLDSLLRMSSGLDFLEADTTERISDVTRMLFGSSDAASYMLGLTPVHRPSSHFNYSSGDSVLLSYIIRRHFGDDEKSYLAFPWNALFEPLGMRSAVFEQDASGLYLGGTHMLATPRDWARFGLLYLRDGVWQGRRLLSKKWLDRTRQATSWVPQDGNRYGLHFWLVNPKLARERGIPQDTYLAAGFKGQAIFIIPSLDLVVVRMGWTEDEDYKPYEILESVTKINFVYKRK